MPDGRQTPAQRSRCGWFCLVLAALIAAFLSDSLLLGNLLSPADLLASSPPFAAEGAREPSHRLLTDAVFAFTPFREMGFAALRAGGRIPRVNHDIYCGVPYAANFITAPYYPLRWVPASVSPRLHALGHALELFLAGLGLYLLAARLGLGEPSRWLGGLVWAFSGALVVWRLSPLSAAIWTLPWILLGLERLLRGAGARALALTAMATCLCWLAGHPQTAVQLFAVVAAYGLYRVLSKQAPWSRLGRGTAATALGTGLAALFLLPAAHYLLNSHAWQERVTSGSAWELALPSLQSLPGFLFPYIWGSRLAGWLPLDAVVGAGNTSELGGGYVSFLLPFGLLPLAWWRRRQIRDFWFWSGGLLICLALAVRTPVVSHLYGALPVLGAAKPQRLVIFAGFAIVLLSMGALDALRREPLTRREARRLVAVLALVGLGALAAAGGFRLLRPTVREQVEARLPAWSARLAESPALHGASADELVRRLERTTVRYPLWIGIVSLAAVGGVAALGNRRRDAAPLVALAVVDLFAFGRGYTPAIPAAEHYPDAPALRFLQDNAGSFRAAAEGRALPPNVLSAYGVADIRGLDAVEPRDYMELAIRLFGMEDARPSNFKFYAHTDYTHPFVDFLGLKYLLTDRPLAALASDEGDRGRFRAVFEDPPGVFVYENQEALPGYYLARRLTVESDRERRLQRLAGWETARLEAIVETGASRALPGGASAREVERTDRSLRFAGEFPSDSFLAVATNHLAGWSCAIDGRAREILRTNHAFLGVHVPAGSREIVFTYRTPWLAAGAVTSAACLATLMAWLYLVRRRSPRTG